MCWQGLWSQWLLLSKQVLRAWRALRHQTVHQKPVPPKKLMQQMTREWHQTGRQTQEPEQT
jgi:hypothetical protein